MHIILFKQCCESTNIISPFETEDTSLCMCTEEIFSRNYVILAAECFENLEELLP